MMEGVHRILGILELLFTDPLRFLDFSIYRIPAVLIALCFHEWGHAFVAYRCGDPTAKRAGRMSINPLRHLDPVGTLLMFLVGFGWAKPVPVNSYFFRNGRWDDLKVSLAGITVNLCIFLLCTLVGVWVNSLLWNADILTHYTARELLSYRDGTILYLLSGYGEEFSAFYARPLLAPVVRMVMQIGMVNLYIAIFNLIPIPPLDGYHVLNDLVLRGRWQITQRQAQAGMGLVLLLSMTGLLGKGLSFVADSVQEFLLSIF